MPSIIYASSLEVEVYILVVDAGLNYVTVSYQSINLLNIFLSNNSLTTLLAVWDLNLLVNDLYYLFLWNLKILPFIYQLVQVN